jgi:glycosyltransferase involved in cell wall biosynthesis
VLGFTGPMEVIHNFFTPRPPRRSREEVRRELGLRDELVLFHASNLRPLKRIDVLLQTLARLQPRANFKLLLLAGGDFSHYAAEVLRLGLEPTILLRENVSEIEDYLQVAELGLFTSDSESFCLSILEGMFFGCPSVATRVGGIPEVIEAGRSGLLAPAGDAAALAAAVQDLLDHPARRRQLGLAAQQRARECFTADAIVPRYEELYRRVCRSAGRNYA